MGRRCENIERIAWYFHCQITGTKVSKFSKFIISMVSCQKGPTRHAYAWQIGPFWQDTLDMYGLRNQTATKQSAKQEHNSWNVMMTTLKRVLGESINSPQKGQMMESLMFPLLLARTSSWTNSRVPVIWVTMTGMWCHCNVPSGHEHARLII